MPRSHPKALFSSRAARGAWVRGSGSRTALVLGPWLPNTAGSTIPQSGAGVMKGGKGGPS